RTDHGGRCGRGRVARRPRRESLTEIRDVVHAVGPVAGDIEDLAAGRAAQIEPELEPPVVAVQKETAGHVGDGAPGGIAVVIADAAVAVPVNVAYVPGLRAGLRTCLDLGCALENAGGLEHPERPDGGPGVGAGHAE